MRDLRLGLNVLNSVLNVQDREFLSIWSDQIKNIEFDKYHDNTREFVVSFKNIHPTAIFDAVSIKVRPFHWVITTDLRNSYFCMRLLKDDCQVYKKPKLKNGFTTNCHDKVLDEIETLADISNKIKLYAEGSSKRNPDDGLLKAVYSKMWDGYGAIRSRGTSIPKYFDRELRAELIKEDAARKRNQKAKFRQKLRKLHMKA
jgi:hypothetical protein